jgi:N-acetylglucosamine-6-phosphate deacetylase
VTLALTGARIFTGTGWLEGRTLLVEGGRIAGLVAPDEIPAGAKVEALAGDLVPGFVDVQVNGGGGVLFNDEPTVAALRTIGAAHRRFGTTGFLPTLISDAPGVMDAAIDAVAQALEERVPGVLGIHLEGPFLSPDRRGVHAAGHLRTATPADVERLCALGDRGVTVVTLAPERAPPGLIEALVARGAIVCIGHTAADHDMVRRAIASGARGFTHLYNAMTPLGSREPGAVGAALADASTWCGVIADGHHVHFTSLAIAIAAKAAERTMLVTDAMATVGTDLAGFDLHGEWITVQDGRLTTAEGTLAGSALDMATAVRNAIGRIGVPEDAALRMATSVPAAFLGLAGEIGTIAPGRRADLALLDADRRVLRTWT